MPERTIKVTAAYYVNSDGVSVMANQGDKVDVHADHVKRFDELNVLPERFIDEPKGMESDAAAEVDGDDADDKPRRGRPRKTDAES